MLETPAGCSGSGVLNDKVADDSNDHVTATEEESRDAALDADDFNADESGDLVTSIYKDLPEATSSILLAAKASGNHEIKDPVPPTNEDLKETPADILFADRIYDVRHDSSDHEISTDTDLEEATSGAIFVMLVTKYMIQWNR